MAIVGFKVCGSQGSGGFRGCELIQRRAWAMAGQAIDAVPCCNGGSILPQPVGHRKWMIVVVLRSPIVFFEMVASMRVCVQRVKNAHVEVDGERVGEIQQWLLILLGVEQGDVVADLEYLVDKCAGLRIFEDEDGKMNRSVEDVGGQVLVVSQFTLLGNCKKGKRPSFVEAAPPDLAKQLYESFVAQLKSRGLPVETGQFQADMQVTLCNDGPVTILIDSRKRF